MGLDVKGFDDLFGTLDLLGNVGDKVGKKAVKEGLGDILNQMENDAPKDTGNSAKKLDITRLKQYKGGTVWGACGIGAKNWEETKGLWYQHYGYENHINGKRVENNVGWMTSSFEKSKQKAENKIVDVISSELDSILK